MDERKAIEIIDKAVAKHKGHVDVLAYNLHLLRLPDLLLVLLQPVLTPFPLQQNGDPLSPMSPMRLWSQ